jgi:hypothetical protein
VTAALGAAIGKPGLACVQFPPETAVRDMTSAGFSADVASKMVELQLGMSSDDMAEGEAQRPQCSTIKNDNCSGPSFALQGQTSATCDART